MNVQKINIVPNHRNTISFKNNEYTKKPIITPQKSEESDFKLPSKEEALAQKGIFILSSTKTFKHPDDGSTEKQKYTAYIKDGQVLQSETTINYFSQNGDNYGTVIMQEDADEGIDEILHDDND